MEQFQRQYESPCPAGVPLKKGDFNAATLTPEDSTTTSFATTSPLEKGGSRGDQYSQVGQRENQIDFAAIAKKRHLSYKRGYLPYNPKLVERAKVMRKNMTPAEKKLWYDFLRTFPERVLRQRPIDHFIVDFYCSALKLVIEVDGSQHYSEEGQAADAKRTAILESYGLQVLRFDNYEVLQNFESVCQAIKVMTPSLFKRHPY